MAPSAGSTANLPMFIGDLNGRLTSGSRYRSRIREMLTTKKMIKIMKLDMFATTVMSPINRNNIENNVIARIAAQGVCLFG